MLPYHPISATQEEYFRKSGALLMLEYGSLLSRLARDPYAGRRAPSEIPQRDKLLKQIKELQSQLQWFFEVDNKNAILKQHICKTNSEKTKISIPITSILSFLSFKLIIDASDLLPIATVAGVCSTVDPDGASVLEYHRIIKILCVEQERLLRVVDEASEHGTNLHAGFANECPFLADFLGRKNVPFLKKDISAKLRTVKNPSLLPPPCVPQLSAKEIESRFRHYVIGQEDVVRALSVRISLHLTKANKILKNENVTAPNEVLLLIGSPSSGKTYIANTIPKILSGKERVPFTQVSAADCTETGYVGLDVCEVVGKGLIQSALGNIPLAMVGVSWIDELDKRAYKTSSASSTDISAGFQYGLLRFIEGQENLLNEKRVTRDKPIIFNSFGTCFLLGGAFQGLDEIIKRRQRHSTGIGFSARHSQQDSNQLLMDCLVDYGISRQLLSRCTAILQLTDPTEDELLRILSFHNGILSSYNQLLSPRLNIALSEDAQLIIAKYAHDNRTFARGMKFIVSGLIERVVYDEEQGQVEITGNDVQAFLKGMNDSPVPNCHVEEVVTMDADVTDEPCSACGG